MNKANKIIWGVVVVVAIILIIIFGGKIEAPADNIEGETIKIGYIGPLTGDSSVLGIDAVNSIGLAIEQANSNGGIDGKRIELIIEDDQYDTPKTLSAYQKLVNIDKVENIMISTYGGLFAIAEQAKNDNILVVDVLDCDKDIANLPDNIFCVAKESEDFSGALVDFSIKRGYKNIGIMVGVYDKFLPSLAKSFSDVIGDKADIQIEEYLGGETDYKTQLLKLKDKDAILFFGDNEVGLVVKQARDLGMKQSFLSLSNVASPSTQESSKGTVEGIYFSDYSPSEANEVVSQFQKDFEEKFERQPYIYIVSDQAYDTAKILIEKVLSNVKGETKEERINEKIELLHKVKDYEGVTGTLTMKDDGRISGISIQMFRLENLIPVLVED